MSHPLIIQGGMGAGVSDWRLACAVSGKPASLAWSQAPPRMRASSHAACKRATPDGRHAPRSGALSSIRGARRTRSHKLFHARFWRSHSASANHSIWPRPCPHSNSGPDLVALTVLANFVEVFLAKEGHNEPVGINFLGENPVPHSLPSIFGTCDACGRGRTC